MTGQLHTSRTQPTVLSSVELWVVLLAVIATAAYCLAAGFLSLIWSTLSANPDHAPWLTRLTVMPWGKNPVSYLWHWNLLALASLLLNSTLAWRLRSLGRGISLAFLAHVYWLLLATFLHLSGFAASMVDVIYVLE